MTVKKLEKKNDTEKGGKVDVDRERLKRKRRGNREPR